MNNFLALSCLAICFTPLQAVWNGAQKTLVPAYFYPPSSYWDNMISTGAGIIIANPNSGPGTSFDSNYNTYINKARKANINVSICFEYLNPIHCGVISIEKSLFSNGNSGLLSFRICQMITKTCDIGKDYV